MKSSKLLMNWSLITAGCCNCLFLLNLVRIMDRCIEENERTAECGTSYSFSSPLKCCCDVYTGKKCDLSL